MLKNHLNKPYRKDCWTIAITYLFWEDREYYYTQKDLRQRIHGQSHIIERLVPGYVEKWERIEWKGAPMRVPKDSVVRVISPDGKIYPYEGKKWLDKEVA